MVTIAYMKRPEYILHTPLKRGSCLHQWRKAQLEANILNANMFFLIYMVIARMFICFGVCLKIFLRYLQKLNISGKICRDSTQLILLVPLTRTISERPWHDWNLLLWTPKARGFQEHRTPPQHSETASVVDYFSFILMSGARDIFVKHPCFISSFFIVVCVYCCSW